MAKKALIIGINKYPTAPLRGCVNDAMMVSEMLTEHFGFKAKDKRMLTDESATTKNILERLDWLVEGAEPGDILHFHFSGHGSQMVDSKYDTDEEPDGMDEILCPVDLNWRDKVITDDQLKAVFDRVPAGVNVTVVLDCCHSGGGMDHTVQYQPLAGARGAEFGGDSPNRARLLPMPADIANRGMGLNLQPRPRQVRSIDDTALMISGCKSDQTSADAWIDNQFCGAATYAFIETLKKYDFDVDYKTVVDDMNDFMVAKRFTQRPELNGSPSRFGKKVLEGKKPEGSVVEEPVEEEVVVPTPEVEIPSESIVVNETVDAKMDPDKKKKLILIGVVAAAILFAIGSATGIISF